MQDAKETMQTSINSTPSALAGSLDQRQVAGLWMLGATALLVVGTFTPHLITIFDEVMGIPFETNIGIFGTERCVMGGCESIPLGLGVGSLSMVMKLVILVGRAAAIVAIIASGMAGIIALTGKRVRGSWVEVPVGIFLCLLLLLVLYFEGALFSYVVEQVIPGGSDAGDRKWGMPGISLVLLLVGTSLAIRTQVKRLDAHGAEPRVSRHVPESGLVWRPRAS